MEIILNEVTGIREMHIDAVLKSIGTEIRETADKKTPFRWCKAEVTYPNGKTKIVDGTLWEASLEALPDAFTTGNVVSLAVQLSGDYAGFSKVGLPTVQKVDITQFQFDAVSEEVEVEA